LIDMENVALYDDLPEAVDKLNLLGNRPELVKAIAANGNVHAQRHFNPRAKAEEVYNAIQEPIGENRYRSLEKFGIRFMDRIRFLPIASMGRRSVDKFSRARKNLHPM